MQFSFRKRDADPAAGNKPGCGGIQGGRQGTNKMGSMEPCGFHCLNSPLVLDSSIQESSASLQATI